MVTQITTRADALVLVHSIHAGCSIEAWLREALVHLYVAACPRESWAAEALELSWLVVADAIVLTNVSCTLVHIFCTS